MSYYLESEGLNLNKFYTNISYTKLTTTASTEKKVVPISQDSIPQHSFFYVQEKDLMIEDVNNMAIYFRRVFLEGKDLSDSSSAFPFLAVQQRLCFYIQQYQEQPILLDQVVEALVTPIMEVIKEFFSALYSKTIPISDIPTQFDSLIMVVYLLCKVRGHKQISKFFPHEVKDLEPVVFYLIETKNSGHWESKFVALLWLSMIVLMPFPLDSIDSSGCFTNLSNGVKATLVTNLMELGKDFLNNSTKLRDIAAFFISQLFTRQDVLAESYLSDFIDWAVKACKDFKKDEIKLFSLQGVYCSLFEIFKNGQRKDLIHHLPQIVPLLALEENSEEQPIANAPAIRHFKAKLSQRVALVYLHEVRNTWAYRKSDKRVIGRGNSKINANQCTSNNDKMEIEFDTEGVNFDDIETIIDLCFSLLRDRETHVRWSAAKGLGRIAERLEQPMAEDILNMILELFSPHESESSWHGSCLAIAELMKRGLLLPTKVKEVFPFILSALTYDVPVGNIMSGSNVRDSACYMVWSLSRSYSDEVLSPYILSLSQNLLNVSLFDKEVSCRRAASASFQECVGRLGNIPHGIPILTEADYFTVGIRSNSFLRVGVYVASFDEYFESCVLHLANVKLDNLDEEVRKLAAATLSLLCPIQPKFMVETVIPILLSKCRSNTLHIMHGGFLGISEIILGLAGLSEINRNRDEFRESVFMKLLNLEEKKLLKAGEYLLAYEEKIKEIRMVNHLHQFTEEIKEQILSIISAKRSEPIYKGKSGEMLKRVFARFLECASLSKVPLNKHQVLELFPIFEESIRSPNVVIRDSSISAMKAFCGYYFETKEIEFTEIVLKFVFDSLKDPVASVRQGFTLALGSFSDSLINSHFNEILNALKDNTKAKDSTIDDPELKAIAIRTFVPILQKSKCLTNELIDDIFKICFIGMSDYTIDKRGDIGSVVRESAMNTQLNLIKSLSTRITFPSSLLFEFVGRCLQQVLEKIDKMRLIAGFILQDFFLNCSSSLVDFPGKSRLQELFSEDNIKSIWCGLEEESYKQYISLAEESAVQFNEQESWINYPWNQPNMVFPVIVPLLEIEEYSCYLLEGLVVSVGGLTESTQKSSFSALSNYLNSIKNSNEKVEKFLKNIIELMERQSGNERILIPFFKTLEVIFEIDGIFGNVVYSQYFRKLRDCLVNELKRWKSTTKVLNAIGALNGIMNISELSIQLDCIKTARRLLTHKYPAVRKLMADKFYMFLMIHGESIYGEDVNEGIMEKIIEIDWAESSIDDLKVVVESLELVKE